MLLVQACTVITSTSWNLHQKENQVSGTFSVASILEHTPAKRRHLLLRHWVLSSSPCVDTFTHLTIGRIFNWLNFWLHAFPIVLLSCTIIIHLLIVGQSCYRNCGSTPLSPRGGRVVGPGPFPGSHSHTVAVDSLSIHHSYCTMYM